VKFEYDSLKNRINLEKHNINFEDAQYLWEDINRIKIKARSDSESRYALIASYEKKLWTAFYTIRNEHIIRLISVRRAKKQEERLYYESK